MVTRKCQAIWRIIRSSGAQVFTQKHVGAEPDVVGFGRGSIKDMVLVSKALRESYDGFVDTINQMATETGELHALQEIRDAITTLEHTQ